MGHQKVTSEASGAEGVRTSEERGERSSAKTSWERREGSACATNTHLHPAVDEHDDAFGSVPDVEVLRKMPEEVCGESDIHDTPGVDDLVAGGHGDLGKRGRQSNPRGGRSRRRGLGRSLLLSGSLVGFLLSGSLVCLLAMGLEGRDQGGVLGLRSLVPLRVSRPALHAASLR